MHENPFIRELIEQFTQRELMRLQPVRDELIKWVQGKYHIPSGAHPKPAAIVSGRWTPDQLSLVRIYLEHIPPETMTERDHFI